MKYKLYTDGSYSIKRERGGIAWILTINDQEQERGSKAYSKSTSQRMELLACIIPLEKLENQEIEVISDSQYLVCTMNDGWKRNKNHDLWERLEKVVKKQEKVTFTWVKGHDVDEFNKKCDEMAQKEMRK